MPTRTKTADQAKTNGSDLPEGMARENPIETRGKRSTKSYDTEVAVLDAHPGEWFRILTTKPSSGSGVRRRLADQYGDQYEFTTRTSEPDTTLVYGRRWKEEAEAEAGSST